MKRILILVLAATLSSLTTYQETNNFIGTWKGEDNGETALFVFDEEGYASFEFNDLSIGGKEFMYQGKKGSMVYTINDETSPIQVDFTVTQL